MIAKDVKHGVYFMVIDVATAYNVFERVMSFLDGIENRQKMNKIVSDLDSIIQKVDQLFLREIKAGFESLADVYITANNETKKLRLNFAEEHFLKNAYLDSKLSIGDYPSSYLMALSHYGLSIICHLRKDDTIAFKHILQMYKLSPKLARTQLLPEFYDKGLGVEVKQRVNSWHMKELDNLNKKDFKSEEYLQVGKTLAVAGVGLVTSLLIGNAAPYFAVKDNCSKMIDKADPSYLRKEAISKLEKSVEVKTDEFCIVVANELLTSFGPK